MKKGEMRRVRDARQEYAAEILAAACGMLVVRLRTPGRESCTGRVRELEGKPGAFIEGAEEVRLYITTAYCAS